MDEHTHVNRPPLPFPLQHALAQTVAAPDFAQEAAVLMILWSGQRAGLCRWMEATEFITPLVAESGVVFLLAAAEKAFPVARSSIVYRC
jgi:hypothetical protein